MIVVVEHNNKNELSYTVSLKSNGKTVSSRNIHYQTAKAEKNGKEYLMIYDSDKNPRSDAFDFLNVVFICKCIWQVWHFTVKFLQFCHGILFFELEWDDIVRSVTVGKL